MRRESHHRGMIGVAVWLLSGCLLAACSAGGTSSDSTVAVTIEPQTVTVVAGTAQPFAATVTGTANAEVRWSVEEGAPGGSVSSTGIYRAPFQANTFHVTAASRADPSRRGRATVSVVPSQPIGVAIASPNTSIVVLSPGKTVAFLANVTGTGNRNVGWSLDTGRPVPGGSITVDGVYTAPPLAVALPYITGGGSITVIVRASSVVDPSKSATRPVVIEQGSAPVTISPPGVAVGLGGLVTLALSESVSSSASWTVGGVVGGHDAVGTISDFGAYTAPFQIPNPATVVIGNTEATSAAAVRVVSRFLPVETIPVQACLPPCLLARPGSLAAADFNRDGLSDLITANPGSGTVSLLLAADSVSFAAPYRLPVGSPDTSVPLALVAVPLNSDESPDVAAAGTDLSGSAVWARLGVGDGTFGAEVVSALPADADPVALAAGVFDADSISDLVVADAFANVLRIFEGVGDGVFSLRMNLTDATRIPRPTAVAVADFDRNGRDDLAVAAGTNVVSVWYINQDGSVGNVRTATLLAGSVPAALIAADLNADTVPDLVIAMGTPPGVSVILNTGGSQAGVFGVPSPPIPGGSTPAAAATGDFNRDGVPDVVVADRDADAVTTYFGDGSGALVPSETYLVGRTPQAVATGDVNGDGWPDIAVANSRDDTVSVLRNRGGPSAQ